MSPPSDLVVSTPHTDPAQSCPRWTTFLLGSPRPPADVTVQRLALRQVELPSLSPTAAEWLTGPNVSGTRHAAPRPGHLLHPRTDDRLRGPCRGSWGSGRGGSLRGQLMNRSPQAPSSTPSHSGVTLSTDTVRIDSADPSPWALPCIHAQHSSPSNKCLCPQPRPCWPPQGHCWPPQGHCSNRSALHYQHFVRQWATCMNTHSTVHIHTRGYPHLKGRCPCART